MPYIKRNAQGTIEAIALQPTAEFSEELPETSLELQQFLEAISPQTNAFDEADRSFVRVLEDLVDLLLERDIVRFTDFPEAAQQKLLSRRSMRKSMNTLNLLGDNEDTI